MVWYFPREAVNRWFVNREYEIMPLNVVVVVSFVRKDCVETIMFRLVDNLRVVQSASSSVTPSPSGRVESYHES